MNKTKTRKNYKVVDNFNGWSSEPMTAEEAERYVEINSAPTSRSIESVDVEWVYVENVGWLWK